MQTSGDVLVKMCLLLDISLPSRKSIYSKANKLIEALSLDVDLAQITVDDLKSLVCDQQRAYLWNTLCAKPLHGKFVNWCSSDAVDMSGSCRWLSEFVYSESESTIFAIQDQVIRTRVYKEYILCRLCCVACATVKRKLYST